MLKEIKKELIQSKDEKYQAFSASLIPDIKNLLGVRMPLLNKIAKRIVKEDYKSFLKENTDEFMELTLLEGMIIGYLKLPYNEIKPLIKKFIPKITNWSICDTFCGGLKIIKQNKENFKTFLEEYFSSDLEFYQRFCYVILLKFYVEDDLDYVFNKIKIFKNENYYAQMAVAWLLAECFIKNFSKTENFIKTNKIQDFVYKKGITKALESFRLTSSQKDKLRSLKSNF